MVLHSFILHYILLYLCFFKCKKNHKFDFFSTLFLPIRLDFEIKFCKECGSESDLFDLSGRGNAIQIRDGKANKKNIMLVKMLSYKDVKLLRC